MRRRLPLRVALGLAFTLVGALALTDGLAAQVVYGIVSDASTGEPVQDARLFLLGESGERVASAESGEEGDFELRVRVGGRYSVQVERLGYLPFESETVEVLDGAQVEVQLRLGVDAIPLSPFVVLAEAGGGLGRQADFERRRNDPVLGGHFLGAEEIRARPNATPTQLTRALPAVRLYQVQTVDNPSGMDRSLIYLPGSRGGSLLEGQCLAQVFVNGVPFRQTQDGRTTVDDILAGATISGIEVYSRAAAAPVGYIGTGECGVVMYWTEEPVSTSGDWNPVRVIVGVGVILGVLIVGLVG